MKFGKQLSQDSVAEWADKYVSYKQLKRMIKRGAMVAKASKPVKASSSPPINNGDAGSSLYIALPEDKEKDKEDKEAVDISRYDFQQFLARELAKVNTFFREQLQHLQRRIPLLQWRAQQSLKDASERVPFSVFQSKSSGCNSPVSATGSPTTPRTPDDGGVSPPTPVSASSLHHKTYSHGHGHRRSASSVACEKDLMEAYMEVDKLIRFRELNFSGFRKIVKKWDKQMKEHLSTDFMQQLRQQTFFSDPHLDHYENILQELYSGVTESRTTLKDIAQELKEERLELQSAVLYVWKPWFILLAFVVGALFFFIPIFSSEDARAQRCLSMLSFITVLWVTEAVPFFVSSLSIPLLTVCLKILADDHGHVLAADAAAAQALSPIFNHTVALVIGGLTISAAFTKFQFELKVASLIQRRFGSRPWCFLLAFMFLAFFLSMWVSNVAAALLSVSLLLPIVRDFPTSSPYVRCCLLAISFSCNIGGMLSPIASPQNAIAISKLTQMHPDREISFISWLEVAVPFCLVLLIMCWVYLLVVLRPDDVEYIPALVYEPKPHSHSHTIVLLVSAATVLLWCTFSLTSSFLGDLGIIALLPVLVFFGTGILTKDDFLYLSWNLVILIGGGNVLGAAVDNSRLLHIISDSIAPFLQGQNEWVAVLLFAGFTLVVTSFVSHTVSALILTPVVIEIGSHLGNLQAIVMTTTLMCSGAMALPMTSFPNVNSLLTTDDFDRPYLFVLDFVRYGGPFSLIVLGLLLSWGYLLMWLAF